MHCGTVYSTTFDQGGSLAVDRKEQYPFFQMAWHSLSITMHRKSLSCYLSLNKELFPISLLLRTDIFVLVIYHLQGQLYMINPKGHYLLVKHLARIVLWLSQVKSKDGTQLYSLYSCWMLLLPSWAAASGFIHPSQIYCVLHFYGCFSQISQSMSSVIEVQICFVAFWKSNRPWQQVVASHTHHGNKLYLHLSVCLVGG